VSENKLVYWECRQLQRRSEVGITNLFSHPQPRLTTSILPGGTENLPGPLQEVFPEKRPLICSKCT